MDLFIETKKYPQLKVYGLHFSISYVPVFILSGILFSRGREIIQIMLVRRKKGQNERVYRIRVGEVNSVLALAASFMLTGIPPAVCESVISDIYCSVRKSLHSLLP